MLQLVDLVDTNYLRSLGAGLDTSPGRLFGTLPLELVRHILLLALPLPSPSWTVGYSFHVALARQRAYSDLRLVCRSFRSLLGPNCQVVVVATARVLQSPGTRSGLPEGRSTTIRSLVLTLGQKQRVQVLDSILASLPSLLELAVASDYICAWDDERGIQTHAPPQQRRTLLQAVLQGARGLNLRSLSLSGNMNHSPRLTQADIDDLFSLPSLHHLALTGFEYLDRTATVAGAVSASPVQCRLHSLGLQMKRSSLEHIVDHLLEHSALSALTFLELAVEQSSDDAGESALEAMLLNLARSTPLLYSLTLSGARRTTLHYSVTQFQSLTHLTVTEAEYSPPLLTLPGLEALTVLLGSQGAVARAFLNDRWSWREMARQVALAEREGPGPLALRLASDPHVFEIDLAGAKFAFGIISPPPDSPFSVTLVDTQSDHRASVWPPETASPPRPGGYRSDLRLQREVFALGVQEANRRCQW